MIGDSLLGLCMLRRIASSITAIGIAVPAASSAQSEVPATSIRGACAECGVAPAAITTIDGRRVPELAGLPYAIARDRLSRIFVNPRDVEPPIVLDSTGRYLRALAAFGRGPSETESAGWIDARHGDSIRAIAKERMLVFGPDLKFVRGETFIEPFPYWLLSVGVLANGDFLLSHQQCEPQASCWIAVSQRGKDGRTVRRLPAVPGIAPSVVAARYDTAGYWHIESLPSGRAGYRIDQHGADGSVLRRLERESPDGIARSHPQHVVETRKGHLVVVIHQPKANAMAVAGPQCTCDATESVVEIIDTRTWQVISSRRIPSYTLQILDAAHLATYRHDPDGFPILQIWRFAN